MKNTQISNQQVTAEISSANNKERDLEELDSHWTD